MGIGDWFQDVGDWVTGIGADVFGDEHLSNYDKLKHGTINQAEYDELEGNAPEKTTEQTLEEMQIDLLGEQRDIVEEQQRLQELMAPLMYEEAGIIPEYDETGKIIGFGREEDPLDPMREDIERGFLERTQAALAGELPVPSGLTRQREEGMLTLEETLRKELGPGFRTSTPGIERLEKYGAYTSELEEAARRGDLTLSESLSLSRESSNEARISQELARMMGVTDYPSSTFQRYGDVAQGYQLPISNIQFGQQMDYMERARRSQGTGQFWSAVGQGAGTYLGYLAFCWVAEVLFGVNHQKTYNARLYVANTDNWFTRLYRKHGRKWAIFLERYPLVQSIVRPIWEWMAYKGKELQSEKGGLEWLT